MLKDQVCNPMYAEHLYLNGRELLHSTPQHRWNSVRRHFSALLTIKLIMRFSLWSGQNAQSYNCQNLLFM